MTAMNNDTICAIATATGGALGVIRLSGPEAIAIASRICQKDLSELNPRTAHLLPVYNTLFKTDDPSRERSTPLDEALVTLFRAPHSYTGEDSVEFSLHGSSYILQCTLQALIELGARQAAPGEFTQRAFLNGKMDLSQAEAVADLIASTNRAMHQVAMNQLRGHFSTELKLLRNQLLHLTSLLELELDFSDHEELEFANRSELLDLAQRIDHRVTHLADSFQTGNALKNGVPVAIVGAPNVGKSTLLNALLGEERAIVSDIQGTTRDTIEDTLQIEGIIFRFIDTAGIRHTTDRIESLGIGRTLTAAQRATIILMVTEPGIPYPNIPIRNDQTVIRIINKSDISTSSKLSEQTISAPSSTYLHISAKYNIGLDALRHHLIAAAPKTSDSDVIVTSARHYEALLRTHDALTRVIDGLSTQLPSDLIAEDLRLTLGALADITGGLITPQETLNNIFRHFCVGK